MGAGAVIIVIGVGAAFFMFDKIGSKYLRKVIISSVRQYAKHAEKAWIATSKQSFAVTISTGECDLSGC